VSGTRVLNPSCLLEFAFVVVGAAINFFLGFKQRQEV